MRRLARLGFVCGLLGACGPANSAGGDPDPNAPDAAPEPPDPEPVPEGATALLEIHAMDLWGQELPATGGLLAISKNGQAEGSQGFPVATVVLEDAATYRVTLSAPEHHELAVDVAFDGTRSEKALVAHAPAGGPPAGVSVAHTMGITPDGDAAPVHHVYLGLRHKWFSASGRPARRGNDVELLMDGEEAWTRVRGDLERATGTIHISTWWWESTFELARPYGAHIDLSDAERRANTIMALVDASPAEKRVLVGQFLSQDGLLSWMTVDDELTARGEAGGDGFEFMGQANPTAGKLFFEIEPFTFADRVRDLDASAGWFDFDPEQGIPSTVPAGIVDLTDMPLGLDITIAHASMHQKFMVLDGEVAFIGGMNLRKTDWDSSAHEVFDHRRMLYDATVAERQTVYDREALPDQGPRKDYMVRIAGPAAQDAEDVFQRRWELAREEGVDYSENTSTFAIDRDLAPAGDVQVQVTATLPDPLWEHAIAESWLNAVSNAQDYIYIEDQYFRAPLLNDAIAARMEAVPGLRLVVVTKPINEWTDPGCEWTYKSDELFRTRFPGRYMLLQLRAFDFVVTWGFDETESRFADIDTHSKMLIVDDVFLSVGSANKNNRGMLYEGELNVAVLDHAFVSAARRRILENMLDEPVSDDSTAWWWQLADAAAANDAVSAAWDAEGGDIDLDGDPLPAAYDPHGFVYGMAFRSSDYCFIEGTGEDMFKRAAR